MSAEIAEHQMSSFASKLPPSTKAAGISSLHSSANRQMAARAELGSAMRTEATTDNPNAAVC